MTQIPHRIIHISFPCHPEGFTVDKSALVQVGNKPLPKPMITNTPYGITKGQWVKIGGI